MIRDLAADFRANGVNEFVTGTDRPPDVHCIGFANYGSSITLPLQGIRRMTHLDKSRVR
jgi:hypothetical protein